MDISKFAPVEQFMRKPVPKPIRAFFAVDEDLPQQKVRIVDKRKEMTIHCDTIWDRVKRRNGVIFDKRKIRKIGEKEPSRFEPDYLATVLGNKPPGKKPEPPKKLPSAAEKELEEGKEREEGEIEEGEIEEGEEREEGEEPEPEKAPKKVPEPELAKGEEREEGEEHEPEKAAEPEKGQEEPEIEEEVFEVSEPIIPVPKKGKQTNAAKAEYLESVNDAIKKTNITSRTMLNGKPLQARLPKPEKMIIRAPAYYMANRKLYMQKLTELFKDYNKEIAAETSNASCERQSTEEFQLLINQRVVRDYLNIYTPYRGLLLYHGLGSGKTCTSIALAEGMKSHRRIIVMTPASLKMNFFSELKKCGDALYKKKQFWEFVSIEGQPQNIALLSKSLSLPAEFILKNKGAWLMDVSKKESNYSELSTENQKMLDEQLNAMIRSKYTDINYNGLTKDRFEKMIRNEKGEAINPFSNTTVLIDEVHNFVSRISNKLTARESVSYKLYNLLMDAENVRIVLMTGTPMINYPNELGILYNILRGKIRTWTLTITDNQRLVKSNIIDMFDRANFKTYDYIDYANGKLTITRNPFGFINTDNKVKRGGGVMEETIRVVETTPVDIISSMPRVEETEPKKSPASTKKHIPKVKSSSNHTRKNRKTEHDKSSDKKDDKKDENEKSEKDNTPDMDANADLAENKLDRELEEDLLDYSNGMMGENDPMLGGSVLGGSVLGVGLLSKGGDPVVNDKYTGVRLDEQGNISDSDFINEVKRILRENGVELSDKITAETYKALPDEYDPFLSMFVEDGTLEVKNMNLFKKRILGLTSYFRSAQESLLPAFVSTAKGDNYHIVPVEMSDYQVKTYFRIRSDEIKSEIET